MLVTINNVAITPSDTLKENAGIWLGDHVILLWRQVLFSQNTRLLNLRWSEITHEPGEAAQTPC